MTMTYADWRRERACGRKTRYATQLDANTAALLAWQHGRRATPYPCEWCDGWHLTSNDPDKVRDWRRRLDERVSRCPSCAGWRWDGRCRRCDGGEA